MVVAPVGVTGDCTVVTVAVGDHVTVWVALDTVKVTSVVPERYAAVAAAVARTVHEPVPVYVSWAVEASTEQVDVVNPATTAYEIGAPPRAEAVVDGVSGDCTVDTDVVGDHVTVCELFACPDTDADAFEYPDRDVVTVTVDDPPADRPVTVNGSVVPDAVPALTDPDEAVGLQA